MVLPFAICSSHVIIETHTFTTVAFQSKGPEQKYLIVIQVAVLDLLFSQWLNFWHNYKQPTSLTQISMHNMYNDWGYIINTI